MYGDPFIDQVCRGLRLTVKDLAGARPFSAALALLQAIRQTCDRFGVPDLAAMPGDLSSGALDLERLVEYGANIQDVVARLNKDILRALAAADVKEKLFNQGIETVGSTAEEF